MSTRPNQTRRTTARNARGRQVQKKPVNYWLWVPVVVVAILAIGGIAWYLFNRTPTVALTGLQTYENLSRDHGQGAQTYDPIPPVGGAHNEAWMNCGIYDQPVPNENAVHSLEHGAVWITYRPDLAAADVETLRGLVRGQRYALLSPYPDLPSPVVASAWGVQLRLDSAGDSRLPSFIQQYANGPQSPEPGASCRGGLGNPIQ